MQLIKTIQNFAFQSNLWEKGSKIILGVSGGPDSVCLLDIIAYLAKKYEFKLHIAHVNYNLRGEDSSKDELFVKELGKKYCIEVSCLSPKKADYKGNLENSLRTIRYDYFEKIRQDLGFDVVAVAHNQDDQAETVLMRIIRGSGLNGLASMKAKSQKVVRPLLNTSKADILAYIKQKKLVYRVDKSNKDIKFIRNKVRHGLLPYLESNFNSNIKKTLSEWSISVADDYDFINKSAERLAFGICKNKCHSFSAKKISSLHSAIQRQVLRIITGRIKGGLVDIDNKQIEELIKVIKSAKNKNQKAVIGGLNILKKGDKVTLQISSANYK